MKFQIDYINALVETRASAESFSKKLRPLGYDYTSCPDGPLCPSRCPDGPDCHDMPWANITPVEPNKTKSEIDLSFY